VVISSPFHSLERGAVPPVGDLDDAGVVADDDELQRALQAQCLDPARDGDGLAGLTAQVADGGTDHRFSPPKDLVTDPLEVRARRVSSRCHRTFADR
jgi:hypothetical protein